MTIYDPVLFNVVQSYSFMFIFFLILRFHIQKQNPKSIPAF